LKRFVLSLKQLILNKSSSPTIQESSSKDETSLEFDFLEEYATPVTDLSATNDIEKYLDSDLIQYKLDRKEDQTVWLRTWWVQNGWIFPLVKKVARDYLAIPPSEVDIERLFIEGRDIIGV
jgi:hypothetical protein